MGYLSLGRFGDRRLEKGDFFLVRLVAKAGRPVRIRALGGTRRGEMRLTRGLRNGAVTPEEMIATAAARTSQRVVGRHGWRSKTRR